jgi:hypothetical protein
MSKVIIAGDANGTGVFTIAAPNGNTDRTLVLPDEAGTVLTNVINFSVFSHLTGTTYTNGGARALNTNYTNSAAYDKLIYVSISNGSPSALLLTTLDGSVIYGSSDPTAGAYYSATYIWPAGKVININMNGSPTLQRWVEYA